MSNHPAELVERVAAQLEAWWATDDESGWRNMARYALDLAERAADAAVTAYRLNDAPGNDGVLAQAVRRAVEGA